jgi:hypothetical protein
MGGGRRRVGDTRTHTNADADRAEQGVARANLHAVEGEGFDQANP